MKTDATTKWLFTLTAILTLPMTSCWEEGASTENPDKSDASQHTATHLVDNSTLLAAGKALLDKEFDAKWLQQGDKFYTTADVANNSGEGLRCLMEFEGTRTHEVKLLPTSREDRENGVTERGEVALKLNGVIRAKFGTSAGFTLAAWSEKQPASKTYELEVAQHANGVWGYASLPGTKPSEYEVRRALGESSKHLLPELAQEALEALESHSNRNVIAARDSIFLPSSGLFERFYELRDGFSEFNEFAITEIRGGGSGVEFIHEIPLSDLDRANGIEFRGEFHAQQFGYARKAKGKAQEELILDNQGVSNPYKRLPRRRHFTIMWTDWSEIQDVSTYVVEKQKGEFRARYTYSRSDEHFSLTNANDNPNKASQATETRHSRLEEALTKTSWVGSTLPNRIPDLKTLPLP